MAAYPSLESVLTGKDPQRLLEITRAPRSLFGRILVFFLSVLIVYLLTSVFYKIQGFLQHIPILNAFTPRVLAFIPVLLLLEIVRRIFNDLYILSLHRLTHLKGRLSLSYNVPVVKYADIRAINVIQDFWGRVLNYGDLSIGTSAHEGNEIYIAGVKAPQELAKLMDQLRTHSLKVASKEINPSIDTSITD